MAFRILEIAHPSSLHVQRGQLMVSQPGSETLKVALEDLYAIILLGPDITISSLALSDIAKREIAVVCCNRQFMPEAISLPLVANSRQTAVIRRQIAASDSLRDRLWGRIVSAKVRNQAHALSFLGIESWEMIDYLAMEVEPGDVTDIESKAARKYFCEYMPGLSRREENPLNCALNYGYTIVRTIMARALVAGGFLCAHGIHHCNLFNSYNLADDMIEPYRPTVDLLVHDMDPHNLRLDQNERRKIMELAFAKVAQSGRVMTVANAIDAQVSSLNIAIENDDEYLLALPQTLEYETASAFER